MERLEELVHRSRRGDVTAYAEIVEATQHMVLAVACQVLRDPSLAQDAAQETYIRVFPRIGEIQEAKAFVGWLRRVAITVAMNMRRARRGTFLRLDDVFDVPVLDEEEAEWSEAQRHRLASALLTLTPTERRLCDRRYHGGWSIGRLAADSGVDEQTMRKRLQRVRDKLRREIEMSERVSSQSASIGPNLPAKIVELLSRPQLTVLPDNPVGKTRDLVRQCFPDLVPLDLPEVVDLAAAHASVAKDAIYVDASEFHHVDESRILRYDLTLPLLLTLRYEHKPVRVWSEGKVYRQCSTDATHLEAFHQAEVFLLDDRTELNPWDVAGQVLKSVEAVLPGSPVRLIPTRFPMCSAAWELEAERNGRKLEVIAWGIFSDRIVRHVGGDPERHVAIGVGYGLERLAGLRYDIDDIRKVDTVTLAS